MHFLSRLQLRAKFALLLGLFGLGIVASIGAAAGLMQQRMFDDRIDKLRAIVQSSIGIAQRLDVDVAAGRLTREQALERLGASIHGMRFDAGAGYVIVRRDAVILLHGADPSLEGKPSATRDATGRPLTDLIQDALQNSDEGTVTYLFPKPGHAAPQPKVSYVARFTPWQVVFFAGAYVDDLDAAFHSNLLRLGAIGGLILAVTLLAAWLVKRDIAVPLNALKGTMERLAAGDVAAAIAGTDRPDEIGAMARAVLVFQEGAATVDRLAEQARERHVAAEEKHAALVGMAERIETEMATALQRVSAHTAGMTATADAMRESAERTGHSAQGAAQASAQALANARTLANGADHLAASIRDIGTEVKQSNEVVGRAVAAGAETRATIEALNAEVARIGEVADMIGEIAAKTNLLALNATIEAARAGEAGKGFAVVASEVKSLATQTARSTDEIGRHISEVRSATSASVAAVTRIEHTIGEISAIAGSIAAAVDQQGMSTARIASSVTETASAATEMTKRTTEVSAEAEQTSNHAAEVRQSAAALNIEVDQLRHSVIQVVRTSTSEVDRRALSRGHVDLPGRLTVPGRAVRTTRVCDLSAGGAMLRGGDALPLGSAGSIAIDGVGFAIPFTVRACEVDAMHIAFALDAVAAAEVEQIASRATSDRAA